jgi:beta-galactosidase
MPQNDSELRTVPFDFGLPIGAQYYRAPTPEPEHWPTDLDQLKQHGMNVIKIWAQWRWNQPGKDTFDFDDLDRLMDLAAERDLRVVINTIFDVTPVWLSRDYPDSVMIRQDGRRVGPTSLLHRQIGGAPGPCLHHPFAREQRECFLSKTVERFRNHPALWLWDLWNEPELTCGMIRGGPPAEQVCYCEHSRKAFTHWLQQRYQSIGELNRAWSWNYRSWDEVELPYGSEVYAEWVDWRLFFRDTITEEMRWRAQVTRELDSRHPVMCHTVPPPVFNIACCASDDFELAVEGDLFGNTSTSQPFPTDYCRSAARGRPLICSEIHALPGTTLLRPTPLSREDFEKYILVPMFHGAKGFLFWQYRPERLGKESPAWGMIRSDGTPEPWLEYSRELAGWLQQHAQFLLGARPDPAEVAILVVPENEIFFYCHDHHLDRYWAGILGAHALLKDAGHPVDFIHAGQVLDGLANRYRYLIAPVPYAYPREVADRLADYVRDGGNLLMEGFPCAHNPETGLASLVNPGMGLDEVVGCREVSVQPELRSNPLTAHGTAESNLGGRPVFTASEPIGAVPPETRITGRFAEQRLRVTTADTLATFSDGSAAVVGNRYGKGTAHLVGSWVFAAYHQQPSHELRDLITGLLALPKPCVWAEEVDVSRLSAEGTSWLLLNNTESKAVDATVHLEADADKVRVLPTGEEIPLENKSFQMSIPALGIQVVEVMSPNMRS